VAFVLIGGFLYGPFYASAVVVVPLMTRKIFGLRDYEKIYSRISMSSAIMAAVGTAIWGFLIDWIGYEVLFFLGLLVIAGTAFLGVYALLAGQNHENKQKKLDGSAPHYRQMQVDSE
jgi:MFS family permease